MQEVHRHGLAAEGTDMPIMQTADKTVLFVTELD